MRLPTLSRKSREHMFSSNQNCSPAYHTHVRMLPSDVRMLPSQIQSNATTRYCPCNCRFGVCTDCNSKPC